MSHRLTSFVRELRRRRVGRVAVAYAVTAWALIEVADLVVPRLGFPEWPVTLLIVLAVAGFPVALTLAWFFDVVPDHGASSSSRPKWVAVGAIAAVALIAGAATIQVWPRLMEGPAEVRSLAVLPFASLSDDPEQAYLAAGMQDALITELAQIGAVRVVSRTSTLRYGDGRQPLAEVARELGVDALVEASVLRVGDRLRIQAQLIRPSPRERHLWAEEYDRDVRDALAVHGEMAREIARAIRAPLSAAEAERLATSRPVDPEAYEAYLRGMYFLAQQTPDGYQRGLRHLNQAVALDPGDPAAYAGLALGYSLVGHGTIPDAFERAKAAARRALELDPDHAAAHEALGEIALYHDWDWRAAEEAFRTVLSLNPNLPEAAAHYAWYMELRGRTADALQAMERARRLDPLNPLWAAWAGWIALETDDGAALAHARSALELNPSHPHALYVAARAAAELGRRDEALRLADSLATLPPYLWGRGHVRAVLGDTAGARMDAAALAREPGAMEAFGLALIHAELGEAERAMDWLEDARRARFSWVPWIHRPAVFVPLPHNERYRAMLRAMGLAPAPAVAAAAGEGLRAAGGGAEAARPPGRPAR